MRGYAVNLLERMLRTYSPTGEEETLARLLVDEMDGLGLESWRDEAGNARGEFGSGEPVILLCGHMDTVPGFLPVKYEGGKLFGRGAVDAKSSLAAMISASSTLIKEGFEGKVVLVGAVEEEGVGRGVKHLVEKGVSANYAIFGEPSGVENITIAYKGSIHLKIDCRTSTGHSSAPWLYENAIEECFRIHEVIKEVAEEHEREDSWFYSLTSCLTKMEGGGEFSTVPSQATLHLNLRVPPTLSVERVLKEVDQSLEEYRDERPGVEVDVELLDSCPPYQADKNSILVRSIAYGIRRVRGKQSILVRRTGSGDMNYFGSANRIPVATYGPGDSHLDHTPGEHIILKDYLDSVKILHTGLKMLRRMHLRQS